MEFAFQLRIEYRADLSFDLQFLAQFPGKSLLGRLPCFQLSAGKLPDSFKPAARAAATDHIFAILFNNGRHYDSHFILLW